MFITRARAPLWARLAGRHGAVNPWTYAAHRDRAEVGQRVGQRAWEGETHLDPEELVYHITPAAVAAVTAMPLMNASSSDDRLSIVPRPHALSADHHRSFPPVSPNLLWQISDSQRCLEGVSKVRMIYGLESAHVRQWPCVGGLSVEKTVKRGSSCVFLVFGLRGFSSSNRHAAAADEGAALDG